MALFKPLKTIRANEILLILIFFSVIVCFIKITYVHMKYMLKISSKCTNQTEYLKGPSVTPIYSAWEPSGAVNVAGYLADYLLQHDTVFRLEQLDYLILLIIFVGATVILAEKCNCNALNLVPRLWTCHCSGIL